MRKNIAAVAAMALLAACSGDSLTESALTDDSNVIRMSTGLMRASRADATETTIGNLSVMNVTALRSGSESKFMDGVEFFRTGETYSSKDLYYWPKEGTIDFFAYAIADSTAGQFEKIDYRTFNITPARNTGRNSQIDFVYANTNAVNHGGTGMPVAINFRHAESQVNVAVKNSNPNLRFEITDWKIAYVAGSGTFTYSDLCTDGRNMAQLLPESWSGLSNAGHDSFYEHALEEPVCIPTSREIPLKLDGSMILIPQKQPKATGYIGTARHLRGRLNGAYLAIRMSIYNNDEDRTPIFRDGYACWPVDIDWKPGFKYTYVIDLAGGGYREDPEEPVDPDDPGKPLEPILQEIFFTEATVTVDVWTDGGEIYVTM